MWTNIALYTGRVSSAKLVGLMSPRMEVGPEGDWRSGRYGGVTVKSVKRVTNSIRSMGLFLTVDEVRDVKCNIVYFSKRCLASLRR